MIVLSSQKRYILGTGKEVFPRADMILYSTSTYQNNIIDEIWNSVIALNIDWFHLRARFKQNSSNASIPNQFNN